MVGLEVIVAVGRHVSVRFVAMFVRMGVPDPDRISRSCGLSVDGQLQPAFLQVTVHRQFQPEFLESAVLARRPEHRLPEVAGNSLPGRASGGAEAVARR